MMRLRCCWTLFTPTKYIAEKLNIPSLKVDPEVYAYDNIPSKQMDKAS
jgi:hypothetical protein